MNTALTLNIGGDISKLRSELSKAGNTMTQFSGQLTKIGGLMAGAFSIGAMVSFGKEVFNTTAEFQKFQAVLTNTLGDSGAAKAALSQITEFASKTPFQVNELTASFVKLANQGFIPTLNQMKSLGDLAASQGKSFDQLTEAIIDAQTGEFERLKEFGIRASKAGDQVKFTFKGVQTQTQFTSSAIKDYILSLGEAKGVSGGMEAQSNTLGGGLSNLKDAWEQLTLAIGNSAEKGGFFSWILNGVSSAVKGLTEIFSEASISTQVDALNQLTAARQAAARSGDIEEWSRLNNIIQQGTESVREWYEGQKKLEELQKKSAQSIETQAAATERLQNARANKTGDVSGIKSNPTGAGFLNDIGMLDSVAPQIQAALKGIDSSLIVSGETLDEWGESHRIMAENVKGIWLDMSGMISGAISGIAEGFGEAIAGVGNFGDSILKAVFGFAKQFGEALISIGVATLAAKTLIKNPYTAIAAGVALVALAAAGQAAASKAQGNFNSGGGGSGGGTSRTEQQAILRPSRDKEQITIGGTVEIAGDKLIVLLKNAEDKNRAKRG
jgi:hypothetical protein